MVRPLMNVFPIFSATLLFCLSKTDVDSTFNSYLIPYLFHILINEGPLLETSKFSLYFSGSCIPTKYQQKFV
jgi:hypothetical protein